MKITPLLALLSSSGVVKSEDAKLHKINIEEMNVYSGKVDVYKFGDGGDGEVQKVVVVGGDGDASNANDLPLFDSGASFNPADYSAMTPLSSALNTKSAKSGADSAKASKATTSTTTTSTTTTSTTTPCVGWCRRLEIEGEEGVREDVPLERRLEIIEHSAYRGAKPDATFSFKYDLISKESCDVLIKYMDETLAHALDDEENIPVGTSEYAEGVYETWKPFADGGVANAFHKKLYANDLVRMIGREETLKIIDFFEESLGDLTIDCLYLARHGWNGKDQFLSPWHNDLYATMEITLNNNYEGGHVLHMNADGVHRTDARPGSATAHTVDIVHGITPNIGAAKYMLIAKHHFNRPDKEGVVRLSKEMVDAIEISA